MSEMIRRLARAIYACNFHPDESPAHIALMWAQEGERRALSMARAALKELRNPTDEMSAKGREIDNRILGGSHSAWVAMIDTALQETQDGPVIWKPQGDVVTISNPTVNPAEVRFPSGLRLTLLPHQEMTLTP